jgi:hypothetical protein
MQLAVQEHFAYDRSMNVDDGMNGDDDPTDAAVCKIASAIGELARTRMLYGLLPAVANALEGLSVLAGSRRQFVPNTPERLRAARTCYDHIAGGLGVSLHDRLRERGWLSEDYDVTTEGAKSMRALGIDMDATRALRRRFAFPCLDWSERRPHLGRALGAALLKVALKRRWVTQDLDSRALTITNLGRRELSSRFEIDA